MPPYLYTGGNMGEMHVSALAWIQPMTTTWRTWLTSRAHAADVLQADAVRVALVSDSPSYGELIRGIAESHQWLLESVDIADVTRSQSGWWSLIIIGWTSETRMLPLVAAQASRHAGTRVLVISEERHPQFISDVLRSGADDYLVAPFDPSECLARMEGLIARTQQIVERRNSKLAFDIHNRTITSGSIAITFSPREWEALIILLEAEGQIVGWRDLSLALWGDDLHESAVASLISRMRQRIDEKPFPALVVTTHRGEGYRAGFRRSGDSFRKPHLAIQR